MTRVALITGSTDGIGKETALSLAKEGHTIHILGRNKAKGEAVLSDLKKINPKGQHRFYAADLSTIKGNNDFLDKYMEENKKLDLLILSAGAFPKKLLMSPNGTNIVFMVNYISRYMFSVRLNSLLKQSNHSRVILIAGDTLLKKIDYKMIRETSHSVLKAIGTVNMGNAYLATFLNKDGFTSVPHEFMCPGTVNTKIVKNSNLLTRFAAKFMKIIEPEEAGEIIKNHIISSKPEDCKGKFFHRGEHSKVESKIISDKVEFNELMKFSKEFTNLSYEN